ncbi:putative ATPase involved in replication control, Cdc46/Mcm family [Thermoplasmatales archaeon BRNA1]|nr:putative ATPase involved in replication control, Cdc46/Mcm family [Thermoplasmatales archaeon BRNA1]
MPFAGLRGKEMTSFNDNEITAAWRAILSKTTEDSSRNYTLLISELADNYPDVKSVTVYYDDIDAYSVDFAMCVLEEPDRCIRLGIDVIKESIVGGWEDQDTIHLRITNLPRDAKVDVRNLRAKHLGKLVSITGLVRKATIPKPQLTYARFTCSRCGADVWEPQDGMYLREPLMCPNPNGNCNKTANRFILDEKSSRYTDTQIVEIQESPEGLRGGQQPERKVCFLEDDIAGLISAGNRIVVNGILRSREKPDRDKTTLFDTFLDVLSVEFEQHEYDEINITEEDENAIKEMSKDPLLFEHIVASIAPTIHGMTEVKEAIALQLFGGCHKFNDDGSETRGDMHILLIGDPGVAKSQILRFMSTLAPRGIFASGKSASSAGLTAAAVKDDTDGGRWNLEAGALVLADKGLACIDELDKMTAEDRSSLHEAMESQRISVAKAGITATLQCRCSLLAAANPKFGRFDTDQKIVGQIDLPPALMSRFDLIFVLTDKPDKKKDADLARFILGVHQRGEIRAVGEEAEIQGVDMEAVKDATQHYKPYYERDILRKYVAYAKKNVVPFMPDTVVKDITDTYTQIRASSEDGVTVPITARQLEAFVRLAEASAKMRLSQVIEEEDSSRAIRLVKYYLSMVAGTNGGGYDIDMALNTYSSKDRSSISVIEGIIKNGGKDGMAKADIIKAAEEEGIGSAEARKLLSKLSNNGTLYSPSEGIYKRV